jgi:hypothetical protein
MKRKLWIALLAALLLTVVLCASAQASVPDHPACPKCKSTNTAKTGAVLGGNCVSGDQYEFKCNACKNTWFVEDTYINPDNHDSFEVYRRAKAATCTEDGWTRGEKCTRCGAILTESVRIPKLGHDFSKLTSYATNLVKHTCTRCGDYKICIASSATPKNVTLSNVSDGVKISWSKVTNAKGYYVYRNGTKIATISSNATVSYTDKSVSSGNQYKYSLAAWYKDSKGNGSSTRGGEKTIYYIAPPASLAKGFQNGRHLVSWPAVTGATGYELRVRPAGSNTVLYSASGSYTSWQLAGRDSKTGLKCDTNYTLLVRTYKTVGNTKYYSAWKSFSVIFNSPK